MRQKGQIIIIVVLMITLFLATVSSFVLLILGEMRSQRAMSDSLVAYYAAEAGVEKAILGIKGGSTSSSGVVPLGEATYKYTVVSASSDGKITYTIDSIGAKNQVKRRIVAEVSVAADLSGNPAPPPGYIYRPHSWKEANPSL